MTDHPIALGVDSGFAHTGLGAVSRGGVNGALVTHGVWHIETEKDKTAPVRAGMDDARRMRDIYDSVVSVVDSLRPAVIGVEAYETRIPKGLEALKTAATKLVQYGVPSSRDAFVEMLKDDRKAAAWVSALGGVRSALNDAESWFGVGLGQAAKTIGVVWVCASIGFARGIPVYVYTPTQLKKTIARHAGASKEEVGRVLEHWVEGLTSRMTAIRVGATGRGDLNSKAANDRASHCYDATGHACMALFDIEKYWNTYSK